MSDESAKILAAFEGLEARLSERFDAVEQRLAGVEQRFADVEQRLSGVEQQLVDVGGKVDGLSFKLDALAKKTISETERATIEPPVSDPSSGGARKRRLENV